MDFEGVNSSMYFIFQGMNYIIALLLLVLDDEESVFWLFVTVLEKYLPDYYSSTMSGLRTDMEVMSVLVK